MVVAARIAESEGGTAAGSFVQTPLSHAAIKEICRMLLPNRNQVVSGICPTYIPCI